MPTPLRLYLETSFWSRLVDRTDPVRRRATRRFLEWASRRHFLLASRLVTYELDDTRDPERRRQVSRLYRDVRTRTVPTLLSVYETAWELVRLGCVTQNHLADAFHLAYAISVRADALVTWNLHDLARPHTRRIVQGYCWRNDVPEVRIGDPVEVGRWLHVKI